MPNLNIGSPELWSQFGLPGLVIFSLFFALITIVIVCIKRIDKMDARNTKHSTDMAQYHREERSEWRDSSLQQVNKFEKAINKLADGIRDTRK